MQNVRIGIIGVGIMGERHCRVCANLPRVELIGISDLSEERGRLVADRYGTRYFPDHQALISQLDAIVIATTTPAHYPLVAECLERGLHVLVEKPITEAVQQADKLVQMAKQKNLVLQVGHIERFNPTFSELKNVIEGMALIDINVRRLSPFDTSKTDVDVVRDLMIHDLDLITNLVGSAIEEISARGRSVHTGVIDHAIVTLCFQDGPIASLTSSRVTEQKVRVIEVTAKGAYIQADLLNKSILVHRRTFPQYLDRNSTTRYRQESIIEQIYVPPAEPLMLELRSFVDCVREHRPSQVPGDDGLRALQLADAVIAQMVC